MKRVAIYLRVSTDDQTIENQLQQLRIAGEKNGWEIVEVFKDEGISGAKGRDKRPGFDNLCRMIDAKEIDMVAAWSVDRLSRSLIDLLSFMQDLRRANVDLYLHMQNLDTTTPSGRAMFQMMGVFAEFERSMIQERVKAGMARAKSQGKKLGRPSLPSDKVAQILELRSKGYGILKIARIVGCGTGPVQRITKEAQACTPI